MCSVDKISASLATLISRPRGAPRIFAVPRSKTAVSLQKDCILPEPAQRQWRVLELRRSTLLCGNPFPTRNPGLKRTRPGYIMYRTRTFSRLSHHIFFYFEVEVPVSLSLPLWTISSFQGKYRFHGLLFHFSF
jgi:hypothetical protein